MAAWVVESLAFLIGLFLLTLLLLALFSPFESLGWWAGWSAPELKLRKTENDGKKSASTIDTRADQQLAAGSYVVYLSGILAFSGDTLAGREVGLMERIATKLPGEEVVIGDVFPYSVSNNPLNGERMFSRFWQWLKDRQRNLRNPANIYNWLIFVRNLFQLAVSADPRYGPINNVGVARVITLSLFKHGYPPGSGKPVYLVGYSGGGQVAVGAARYLRQALQAPIYVIGLGAVFTDDPGINSVEHVYQLKGSQDFLPFFGTLLFPGRWPFLPHTAWNRARKAGKISTINTGPMFHFGHKDYFSRVRRLPDGCIYADHTADLVVQAITGQI